MTDQPLAPIGKTDKGAMVADEASNTPGPFDVRTIKNLVRLMSEHDLSEIDLREGDVRLRLRRGGREVTVSGTVPVPAVIPVPTIAPAPAATSKVETAQETKPQLTVTSPTPGTFYTAPSPDAEPFVRVGSRVLPTTVVCIIEAMKIFNEITADCTGVITEVCVDNQQPVEFGQVLFKVDPTA